MSYEQNLADCEAAAADLAAIVNDQSRRLNEANQLLEQTIEVLEGFPEEVDNDTGADVLAWLNALALPLLDNLKARKK